MAEISPIGLGSWPTPLEPAPRLSVAIGLEPGDLWIKRDDLIGLGAGGNKVRKLQYTCAVASRDRATTLVTTGAAQSNHARLTAAAGARLGLEVHLVLAGRDDGPIAGNLILDRLFGAHIHWAPDADDDELDRRAAQLAEELTADGHRVAVIPFGGSSVAGARGYVDCARELLDQAPDLVHVVTAVGSGGTMAGLVHGVGADRVLGVHTGAVADPDAQVTKLTIGLRSPRRPLRIRTDQVGAGYQHLTPDAAAAIELAARTEGVVLDPIYTARALAGLRAEISDGNIRAGERTVFLHSGGLPGLFGHPDAAQIVAS